VPAWLLKASKDEKAEFLAALMGGDGYSLSPAKKVPSDFNPLRLSFNKSMALEKNAWKYACQLKQLFEDLGVKVSQISRGAGNIRKDGTKTFKIVLTLAKGIDNTIRFLEKVGYRYCEEKEIEGNKWLAYLKARKSLLSKRKELCSKALELHKKGLGKIRIGRKLSIPAYQAREWIYFKGGVGLPKSFPIFDDWISKRYTDEVIYEKVISKENAGEEELYDISVDKVHNFVANGCIVHNCHEFLPHEGSTLASYPLIQLLREGRQPGISLVLATQQPGKIHTDVMTQSDIVISHRLTAKLDIGALNEIMQTYLAFDLDRYIDDLPRVKGAGIVLDDNSEKVYPLRIRPRFSWHGGEDPAAIRGEMHRFGLHI